MGQNMASAGDAEAKPREKSYQWAVYPSILLLVLVAASTWVAYAPLGPFIIKEFNLNKGQYGLVGMAASLGGLFTAWISGMAIDRMGIRRGIILGPGLMVLCTIAVFFSRSYWGYLAALLVMGMTYITLTPLSNKIIYSKFPARFRTFAMGLKQSMVPVGTGVSAVLLPQVGTNQGWRYSYLFLAVILIMVIAFSYAVCPKASNIKKAKTPESVHASAKTSFLTVGFMATMAMGLTFTISQSSTTSFIIPFAQEQLGFSLLTASAFLAAVQFSGAISRVVLGLVSDLLKPGHRKWVLAALMLGDGILFFFMSRIGPGISSRAFTGLSILAGIFTMAWYGPYFAVAIELLGEDRAGFASGLGATFTMIGQSFGPVIFGTLVDMFGYYGGAFWVISIQLLVTGVFFSFMPTRKRERQFNRG